MGIDWKKVEELLVTQGEKSLAVFAKEHAKETFYGAIFDIEPFDGVSLNILLSTMEHLIADAGEENAKKLHYKFMPGTFKYSVPVTNAISGWSKLDDAIVEATEADMDEDATNDQGLWLTSGKLIDVVCSVAERLEGSLAKLSRTPDFAISVTPDPSEPGDMALDRYKKFKKKGSKTKPKLSVPKGR